MQGYRRAVAIITVTAFLGGLAEALFLITATRAGFAITNGKARVGVVFGWSLSVHGTLLFAVGLVAVRMILAGYASWRSAHVAAGVVADIRHRLSQAFLESARGREASRSFSPPTAARRAPWWAA